MAKEVDVKNREKLPKTKGPVCRHPLKRTFTLLEVMVGLALLLLASALVGWKLSEAISRKQFSSDLEKLRSRFLVCQRIAVTTHADWKGVLRKKGKRWVFESACIDNRKARKFPPLKLESALTVYLDGEKMEGLIVDFFSTGHVFPEGIIVFCPSADPKKEGEEWKLSSIFHQDNDRTGKRLGPVHPSEI